MGGMLRDTFSERIIITFNAFDIGSTMIHAIWHNMPMLVHFPLSLMFHSVLLFLLKKTLILSVTRWK